MHIASVGVPRLSAYVARAVARPSVATASRCAPVTGVRAFSFARACHRDTAWLDRGRMTYEELKPYTEAPSGKITLIDVREPNEVAQGMIPAAVNVPLSEFGSAFNPNSYSENANDLMTRSCFTAAVASAVNRLSRQLVSAAGGSTCRCTNSSARNYSGSWMDWVAHEKEKQSSEDEE